MKIKHVKRSEIDPAKEYIIELTREVCKTHKLLTGTDLVIFLKTLDRLEEKYKVFHIEK